MELSLMHAGLAAGVALAALPVILHLFMRQTPKHVIFPALRLVRERQKRSRKRMRIKNWLLLLARMALLALMALALSRPRLYSQVPLGDESVPTALGLVFDTSLSMGYKEKDKTRLDEAKERAQAIVDKLPDSSLVFLVDSAEPGTPQGLSPASARKWIADRKIRPVNRPLNAAMGQVYPAVADCDRPYHEVYVLTDLSRTSWNPEHPAEGLDRVEKAKQTKGGKIATFVLKIGSNEVEDVAVDQAEPAAAVATQGEQIEIKGRVRNQGTKPVSRVVELYLDDVKKDQKQVEVAEGGQAEVSFMTPRLEGELHRGELRLAGAPDPLEFNDRRYFTFKVRPALQILLISEVALDADYVAWALDPDPSPSAPRSYQLKRVRPAQFLAEYRDKLRDFAAVFLLNVESLDEESWGLLNGYVHEGGGLVVGLGDRCRADAYNGPTAAQLLPAQPEKHAGKPETTFGKIADVTHPLFSRYPKELASQLAVVPVFKYWAVKLPEGTVSRTLLSFADEAPALIERTFRGPKTGRVLLWSTPLARRVRRSDKAAWNDFPAPTENNWSFLALVNESVRYLAGTSNEQANYEAGENVSLALPPGSRSRTFLLTGPDPKNTQTVVPSASSDTLEVIAPQILGQWSVAPREADGRPLRLGFSLNPPAVESQFAPLQAADLDRIFGKDSYALAEDAKTLQEKVTEQKIGRELFPYIMMLILLLVTLENFLANTFYKESARPASAAAA